MKIRNINGTSKNKCSCGSWIAHWEKFSGQNAPYACPAAGCQNTGVIGAHVQKGGGSTDQNWYIYPLCQSHNLYRGELEVADYFNFVSANKAETCEKFLDKLSLIEKFLKGK